MIISMNEAGKSRHCLMKAVILLIVFFGFTPPQLFCSHRPEKGLKEIDDQRIITKAAGVSEVRIIVKLRVNDIEALTAAANAYKVVLPGLEFPQAGLDADSRLKAAIADAAQEVLRGLDKRKYRINRFYASIPYMALTVATQSLKELVDHPWVLDITEDIPESLPWHFFPDERREPGEIPASPLTDPPRLNDTAEMVGAVNAWNRGYTGSGWYVAVLDAGVSSTHEYFRGKTFVESCFAAGEDKDAGNGGDCPNGLATMTGAGSAVPYGNDWPGFDHGTHVAVIAAGNSGAWSGIARDADIVAVQVFSRFSNNGVVSSWTSDQAAGLDYIYSIRSRYSIAAVNMSVAGSTLWDRACDSDVRKAVIDNLRSVGIATCIATGDNGSCTGVTTPACISSGIAVGSTTDTDERSGLSNWHTAMQKLFAPGSAVFSSLPDRSSSYGVNSSTSVAVSHVTGAWTLLKQAVPSGTVDELLEALTVTGEPISSGCDGYTKSIPRIRVDEAITRLNSNSIHIFSPNGNENWVTASSRPITWNSSGDIRKVDISYSTDNGETWKIIVRNTDDDGVYNWVIPDVRSDLCRVRINDVGGSPLDASDEIFSIVPAASDEITVISPNGGENLDSGSYHDIAWTSSGEINTVMIEYSSDNGVRWETIVQDTANDGSYNWYIPETESEVCLVRITSNESDADPRISDISDQVFSIVSPVSGSLILRSPNGGESWYAGSSQTIHWTSTGDISNIAVNYSVDNGSSWKVVVSKTKNEGSFTWNVPEVASTDCRVRIAAADYSQDPLPSDVSDAVFAIIFPRSLKVLAPNGGEQLTAGSRYAIEWRPANSRTWAKIEYSVDGGDSWTEIDGETVNNGSYDWEVPDTPSDHCLVRISEHDSRETDISDAFFSIVQPLSSDIVVVAPNGGENWAEGSPQQITWNAGGGVNSVSISYSRDNGNTWKSITPSTPNDGNYDWTVPDAASAECRVRVSAVDSSNDPAPSDVSDAVFAIVSQGALKLTAPNGGEQLTVGSRHAVEWRPANSRQQVKIEYTIDGGDSWTQIAEATANDGQYHWQVPDTPSEICLVRISESDSHQVDISDAVFTIAQASDSDITVTAPNGGEQWPAASIKEITWTVGGEANNVSLAYSVDDGTTWRLIRQSTENDGSYDWTVPDEVSTDCRVRITAVDTDLDPIPFDTSDETFSILPAAGELRVLSPNGGEAWEVDTLRTVTWTSSGSIGNVLIEYSFDNGGSWEKIADSTGGDTSYDWRIPGSVSEQCLVRVTAEAGGDDIEKNDVSDSPFAIVYPPSPTVRIITPNGGEQLAAGSRYQITWFSTDSRQKKNLEYSIDGGQSWREIAMALEDNGGYNWLVPDEISDNCLVRVSEEDGAPVDLSDAVFVIEALSAGDVTLMTPNGGENLSAGSESQISWTHNGLNNITIEYSINNGATWLYINTVNAGNESYTWIVPSTPSENCLVRLTGTGGDSNDVDTSDDVFTIDDPAQKEVEVFTPNGGEQLTVGMEYNITWGSSGLENVAIEYSFDNGETWNAIDTAPAASGRYSWIVPDTPSEICRVRISGDGAAPGPSDASDAVFTITRN